MKYEFSSPADESQPEPNVVNVTSERVMMTDVALDRVVTELRRVCRDYGDDSVTVKVTVKQPK